MKIAYILPHLKLYGGVRRALELCNRLQAKGHKVFFYTPSGKACDWFDNLVPVRRLAEAGRDEFDLVVFSLESQYKEPERFKKKAVLYYILHYGPLYKDAETCRASYWQPYYQIANSCWTAGHIEEETGYRPNVVWAGVNHEMFYPKEIAKTYDVLSYGDRSRPWKGRADVERLHELRLGWHIAFLSDIDPPQDRIAETYCRAKVFFSASWFEGWNHPALEAMACGVPLVVTDDGGSADYARDRWNCLIVPPKSPKAAADAIQELLSDHALAERLVAGGIKTAGPFTWERSAETFEVYCEEAINRSHSDV